MTKFNFSARKIKKRKRKEDKLNTTSALSESYMASESAAPPVSPAAPDSPTLETTKRRKTIQAQENRK